MFSKGTVRTTIVQGSHNLAIDATKHDDFILKKNYTSPQTDLGPYKE